MHARENIRFNSICPGPLRTPLLMDFLNTEEKKQRRLVHVPMGRFGTGSRMRPFPVRFALIPSRCLCVARDPGEAREIAYAAVFLASDESSYVTGTDFAVDGGITSAYVTPEGNTTSAPVAPLV